MAKTDNINFRGKYKKYDVNGNPYLYRIGDTVSYNGKKYVATQPTENLIPGTINGSAAWDEISTGNNFYFQNENPYSPSVGDRWYRPESNILYNYVEEDGNKFWLEITNKSSITNKTTFVTGASYSSNIYDYYIGVSCSGTAGIYLPPNPDTGKVVIVKDESGHAGDPYKYIVIRGATATDMIDREASATININNASLQFIYRSGWRII
jgi:hypothetical protein